jgi:hypothetical protein
LNGTWIIGSDRLNDAALAVGEDPEVCHVVFPEPKTQRTLSYIRPLPQCLEHMTGRKIGDVARGPCACNDIWQQRE